MHPLHNDIAATDPLAIKLRDKYFGGAEILTIPITSKMQVGMCYNNVREHVATHGGTETYGWLLSIWPGKFVEALHHSVWRSPSGDLEDITDHGFPLMESDTTTFIVDTSTPIRNDGIDPSVPSKFWSLDSGVLTSNFITATRNYMREREKANDIIARNRFTPLLFDDQRKYDRLRQKLGQIAKEKAAACEKLRANSVF